MKLCLFWNIFWFFLYPFHIRSLFFDESFARHFVHGTKIKKDISLSFVKLKSTIFVFFCYLTGRCSWALVVIEFRNLHFDVLWFELKRILSLWTTFNLNAWCRSGTHFVKKSKLNIYLIVWYYHNYKRSLDAKSLFVRKDSTKFN